MKYKLKNLQDINIIIITDCGINTYLNKNNKQNNLILREMRNVIYVIIILEKMEINAIK